MHIFWQASLSEVNCFMLSSSGAQCQDTEVFAEAGSQAVLPCKYSSKSTVAPAILWNNGNKG